MDPKVWSKLLTLHRRGYGVDVEALRDRCPLRQSSGKGPKMGLTGTESYGGGIRVLALYLVVWGYVGIYRRKEYVRGATRGSRGWRVRLGGWARPLALWPPRRSPGVHSKSSGLPSFQKWVPWNFRSIGLRLIFLFFETLKQGKNKNWHWALG